MANDRWEQVKRLFAAVLKRDPTERRAFLEGALELDPSIRHDVESLIASHDESEGFLSGDSATVTRLRDSETESPGGKSIGPYRILGEIGQGGMGVVYEAEQEKPVRRKVALKLIKWGMDTKAVIARFESERQALALMSHPNIASVHDAGATGDGRPYFAMELVHGEPISQYCDKNRLTVRERLALIIQVCDGVQHAHQKGIIHRDIKPSNILVTTHDDKAVPKLIDFGVAKATAQRLTEKTVYTELGQLIGTPEYMSPEQAEMTGLDIDTRTDVYALGAVLYELLVGAQPFDPTELRKAGFDGIRRMIRESEPPKPSTKLHSLSKATTDSAKNRRVEPRVLEKELRGDLDWITMKALEKDRTRRYGSPFELAADIERHLRHEPVLAGPPSTAYRAGKFIRRHRVAVVASAVVVLALLAGIAGTTVGLIRATRAEQAATREADKAKAINAFMQETLGAANPEMGLGRDATILEALDKAVTRIGESFPDQPEIEAALKNTIGWTYVWYGQFEKAEPLLESALAIRKSLFGNEHTDVAESLYYLGVMRLDRNDLAKKDRELAEEIFQEVLAMRRKLLGDKHPDNAAVLNALGFLRHHSYNYDAAEPFYRESLAIRREALGNEHILVAKTLGNLAALLVNKGDWEGAEPLYQEAIDINRKLFDRAHPQLAVLINGLGLVHYYRKDYEAAEPLCREAAEMTRTALGDKHFEYAVSLRILANVLREKHDYDAAEAASREALSIRREVVGEDHPSFADSLGNLASILMARGKHRTAEPLIKRALDISTNAYGQDSKLVASYRRSYGDCLTILSRYQEAEEHLLAALDILHAIEKDSDMYAQRDFRKTLERLVELYEAWDKQEKAAEYRDLLGELKAK